MVCFIEAFLQSGDLLLTFCFEFVLRITSLVISWARENSYSNVSIRTELCYLLKGIMRYPKSFERK